MLSPRPYVVQPKFIAKNLIIAALCLLGSLGSVAGGVWWIVHVAHQVARDQQIWASGHDAYGVRVGGTSTSHSFIINAYELDVHYVDAEERPHDGKAKLALLFSSIDDHEAVDVKYDAAAPDRFVVSWAVTHLPARWACAAFTTLFAALIGLGLLAVATRRFRAVTDARRVAERSDEVQLELVSVTPVVVKGKHSANIIRFRHIIGGREQVLKQRLLVAEQLMYTSDARTHVVALVSAHCPHRPCLMRADHRPFVGSWPLDPSG